MEIVVKRGQAPQGEVPYTLDEPPPRTLGFADQGAFWANLGVSLLGFGGAVTVLTPQGVPRLSITAAVAATVFGTVLGSLMLGLAAVPGARTGAPSMVLLRGLFGTRLSYVPTALNILQLVGWGTFELVVIAQGAQTMFGGGPRWPFVLAAGLLTTVFAVRPLGAVRVIRRYITVLVAAAMAYFYVQLIIRGWHRLPPAGAGSWHGFLVASDAALAVAISWVPLASDYSRHSRSPRTAFSAAALAYALTQVVTYVLGIVALALVAGNPDRAFDPFLAVPLGAVLFGVLVVREVDQSFADTYSTAVSLQNLRPRADRRWLAVAVGVVTTALALAFDISSYQSFLLLIGSVFVPMFAVLVVDYFLVTGRFGWDVSTRAPSRWGMLAAWFLGFVAYQLVNPGAVGWWSRMWLGLRSLLHLAPPVWASASITSFLVAGAATAVIGVTSRGARR